MFKLIAHTKEMLRCFLIFCPLFILFHASAQIQNFYFTNYSVKDGMSNQIVDDLFRDSEGFLWIATYNGLDRFDGTNFKVFHADYHNPDAIGDDYIQHVCEDHEGNIWCGRDKGVSCYSKTTGKFRNYILSNPKGFVVNANHVYNILCDRQGTIWCSSEAGIFEYDKAHDTFIGYYHSDDDSTSISSDRVYKNSFVEDPVKDGIWMSGSEGINFLDTKTKKFYNYHNNPNHEAVFTNEKIYPLTFDANKNLWFANRNRQGLFCYDLFSRTLSKTNIITNEKHSQNDYNIAALFSDSKNNIWFSTWDARLFYKQKDAQIFNRVFHDDANTNSINSNFFWDMIEDNDGTLWFGGLNGISKFQPAAQYYSLLKPNTLLPANQRFTYINAVLQANDSLLWLGTNAGLYAYNLFTGYCKKLSAGYINYVLKNNNELWLAGINTVSVFNPATKKFVQKNPLPNEWKIHPKIIANIHVCRNGDIWLVTGDTGELYHFKKNNRQWICYKHDDKDEHSIPSLITKAMLEEEDGTMWFSSLEDGIIRFDEKQNRFDFFRNAYTASSKIRIENTWSIFAANKGVLYLIANRAGLIKFRYADSSAEIYKQSDGLATESNFNGAVDNNKNVWVAGYQDVTAFNPAKKMFTRFHIDYAYDNYDYGNILVVLKNGNVAVSIRDALAIYKPAMMAKEKNAPHVIISDFSVFEKSIPFTQKNAEIHLSYKQNFFSISFSAFSNARNPLQYAYKLEGFDKDWVYSGKRQFAAFTNVPGGNYTFLVKTSTADGRWSSPTTIHISVAPPFWQTTWFRILAFAAAIFLIVLIFKMREKNYRSQQEQKLQLLKVRDKIAQDLHDDIGASLSSIRMYSEAVRTQVKEKFPQADMILQRISENAKEIVENMSDIVWAINPKNDSLQFMEDRMHAFTAAVCSSKNIVSHFNKIDFHELKLPMETRKNIFLIFKEAINNAAKYAACKNIYVNMEKRNTALVFSVADDGKGFDVTKATNGNGLTNMQKRAKELNAAISIESRLNEGTVIKLFAPLPGTEKYIPANGEQKT